MQKQNTDNEIFTYTDKHDENIAMRYNREDRLKNASEEVRQMHSSDFVKKRSILQSLTANKGSKAIFFVIFGLAVLNLGLYFFYYTSSSGAIHGIKAQLKSFLYNEELLISVTLAETENKEESTDVVVFIFASDKNKDILQQTKITGIYLGAELRFNCKFKKQNVENIKAVIAINGKALTLSERIR